MINYLCHANLDASFCRNRDKDLNLDLQRLKMAAQADF